MTYEITEAWLNLLQWCCDNLWAVFAFSIGCFVLYVIGAYIGSRIERRKHNEPVYYTNGRWLYRKDRK